MLLIIAVVLLRLPFLDQAVQGDDVYYLFIARNVQVDLLHPMQMGFRLQGELVWDPARPDGQGQRKFDLTRQRELIGVEATTSLEEGLRYVYAGNLPGMVGDLENTPCPACHHLLVERIGYHIQRYTLP